MDDFVNEINRYWELNDEVLTAAYVLWKLNWIHPFINGNGRTARVTCFYVLCLRMGGWLPGSKLLPDLIKQNRNEYVAALKVADRSYATGKIDLVGLHALLERLLDEQLASA